jgi:Retrotransposon gag protein/Zinc knuckle
MATEQPDEWRTQMELDIAAIAHAMQLLAQRVDPVPHSSVSNPSNPASERSNPSPLHESHREPRPSARLIKPASPNDFSGERTKGRAFLNSCELYLHLAPHQFEDEHAKIMWAMSFMKSGRAARFVDRQMRGYHSVGSLPYESWTDFVVEFVSDFCPKNEIQTSRTELETSKYYQGARTVDEYVDDFRELVDRARYFEGSHIVLKFRQGLNPRIQDHVACLTSGRPSDETPKEWYDAAILCDENRIANEAFRTASRTTAHPETSSTTNSMFRRLPTRLPNPPPPISRYAPPIATPSNPSRYVPPAPSASTPSRPKDPSTTVCFRCGQHGHTRPDCPKRFDVRYMDLEERQGFAQEEFVALDVMETKEREDEATIEEQEDFGKDNE